MQIEWQSKKPHSTRFLSVKEPDEQTHDSLVSLGWTRVFYIAGSAEYSKPGSGLFGSWTATEKRQNVREIETRFGKLPHRKLTLADLL